MSSGNHNIDDLHDRLLDHALRETLGDERPPDLAQQILAAASQPTEKLSTLAIGDEAMNANHGKTRRRWVLLAVAASLLVVVGLIFPKIQSERETARRLQRSSDMLDVKSTSADKLQLMVEPQVIVGEKDELLNETLAVEPQGNLDGGGTSALAAGAGPLSRVQARRPKPPIVNRRTDVLRALEQPRKRYVNVDAYAQQSESAPEAVVGNGVIHFGAPPVPPQSGATYGGSGAVPLARTSGTTLDLGSRLGETDGRAIIVGKEVRLSIVGERLHRGLGEGPAVSGDQYTRIYENPFITAEGEKAVSTFSIDVDTASYANVRQFLMQSHRLPPPDAVRIEELVNYFQYDYSGPTGEVPFAAHVEIAGCPWHPEHRLVRIGIKGREVELKNRPQSNLVFLIDVSGSMNEPAKLPLLVEGLKLLTRQLNENDRVAIVVYASSEGLALESTRGDQQDTILAALEKLRAGGSTAGGAGIQLAYKIAEDHFIEGGTNRVILATDGDFNVGTTSTAELERMAEKKAKETGVFLTVLGFGRGNLNDAMMEAISGKGNGNYHYIDNQKEARKVLVEEITGTLLTIAKDVKIQIEFNPAQVAGYRLIGYENRMLRTEDFNDDKKDAGEIGAGHTVTALYEVVPAGKAVGGAGVDALKYQTPAKPQAEVVGSDELLTLKIRYKQPDGDTSSKLEFPITDRGQSFAEATGDFKFAAAVASFGMLLRNSEHRGEASFGSVLEIAEEGIGTDEHGYRAEFLKLVRQAKELRGK